MSIGINPFEQQLLALVAVKVRLFCHSREEMLAMMIETFKANPYLKAILADEGINTLRFMDRVRTI